MMTTKAHAMMREEQFRVLLADRSIGRLRRHEDFTRFVFDEDYVNDPNRPVLGLHFENNLHARFAANMRLPAWFSNLLPEGRLREWIASARRSAMDREMELLAQVGHDLPGAVRVVREDPSIAVDIDKPEDESGSLPSSLWKFSLAGVALKFSLLRRGDRFVAPATGEQGDWIVKLPEPDFPHIPLNEFAMMSLAKASGIDTPDVQLVHRDAFDHTFPDHLWPHQETSAYAVRRFDRSTSRERHHIEDFAQVRGFYPDDKYRGTFETIAALIYRGHDVEGLREFAKRVAFNVLIGNGDAHLKNGSFLYRDARVPSLSPVYDLMSTVVVRPPGHGPEDLGLRFDGKKTFDSVDLASFGALEKKLNAQAELAETVACFVERVLKEFPHVASETLSRHPRLFDAVDNHIKVRARQILRRSFACTRMRT